MNLWRANKAAGLATNRRGLSPECRVAQEVDPQLKNREKTMKLHRGCSFGSYVKTGDICSCPCHGRTRVLRGGVVRNMLSKDCTKTAGCRYAEGHKAACRTW